MGTVNRFLMQLVEAHVARRNFTKSSMKKNVHWRQKTLYVILEKQIILE